MIRAGILLKVRAGRPEPLRWLWRLLTSVRFALWLIGLLALACLAGTLFPQLPAEMRQNPAAVQAWVAFQEGSFGVFTVPLYRLGLFSVFRAPWFVAALSLLVVSVGVCTASRFMPVWRNVMRPPRRVPDVFFDRGRHRLTVPMPAGGVAAVEQALRRRHFRVTRTGTAPPTYLFADRFAWARFGTFASHLSLILLLAGALVSLTGTVEQRVTVAEGESAGVFAPSDPRHLQIHVDAATARFGEDGNPLEYRTALTLFRGGSPVEQGETTVNAPLRYDGFTFHQTSLDITGAALRVRDAGTGNIIFRETLHLTGVVPAPVVVVRRAGAVLYSGPYLPTADVLGRIRDEAGLFLHLAGEERAPVPVRQDVADQKWTLIVALVIPGSDQLGPSRPLQRGDTATVEEVSVEFRAVIGLPARELRDLPGFPFGAILQLAPSVEGPPSLLLHDGAGLPLELRPGIVSNGMANLIYTFEGQRAISGITVRRDPGTWLIWIAVALLIGGLIVTFYVPRCRLWLRLSDDRVTVAGQAGMTTNFDGEMRNLLNGRK
jgi:cytochrome c biogenesis protein ResB